MKKYIFTVNYYDSIMQKDSTRVYLKFIDCVELNIRAKSFLSWFNSLIGVKNAVLTIEEITDTYTIGVFK